MYPRVASTATAMATTEAAAVALSRARADPECESACMICVINAVKSNS